ncbi:MAG: RHS repeat protein [Immundisolibacteraceae bacterium]|nr:RHS repeat protein [Immundisolibacteraceae bacterium]
MVSEVTYAKMNDPAVYTKGTAASYPTVEAIGAADMVHHDDITSAPGQTQRATYHYYNGRIDLTGRGFLGFEYLKRSDVATGDYEQTGYRQAFPYIGMVKNSGTWASDGSLRKFASFTLDSLNLNTNKTHFPFIAQSLDASYELPGVLGNCQVNEVTQTSQYDDYGNLTDQLVTTSDGFTTHNVNQFTNNTTDWHLGRLSQSSVTKSAPNTVDISRTSSFEYDANGLLSKEMIEPGSQFELVTSYTLDGYGNRTSTTVSSGASGSAAFTARTSSITYDAEGRYPVQLTNALGHSETRSHAAEFGQLLTMTGPNGLTTSWQYDQLGRKTLETRADGTTTAITYHDNCTNTTNCLPGTPTNARFAVSSVSTGSPASSQYSDLLGRELRSESVGLDGQAIYVDSFYNTLGQLSSQSEPHFAGASPLYSTREYDARHRVTLETNVDGTSQSTAYNGFETTITNALGQQTTRLVNSQGQLVSVTDATGGMNLYGYDAYGNLTTTTDDAGNTVSIVYDIRGRKVSMDDPSMGQWSYTYNALGELKAQTDALNQTVTLAYDILGRQVSRTDIKRMFSMIQI